MAKSIIVGQSTTALPSGAFLYVPGFQSNATEINTEYAITHDCTFSNLRRHISSGGTGSNVLQLRKNNVDGNLVATGTGTGAASDLTHSDDFISGDLLSFSHTDDGSDPLYRNITLNVEFDGQTGTFFRNSIGSAVVFDVASATRFIGIVGQIQADGDTTEANCQVKVRGYSRVDAFQVRVQENARTTDTVFKLRVNGSDIAASSITIGAGLTGLFMATDINADLADGDLLCAAITTSTGVEDLTLNFVGATLLSASDATELWSGNATGHSRTASATASYYVPGGGFLSSQSTAAVTEITPGFAADCTGLRLHLSANTYSADATLKLFVDGVDSGYATTITAGATGWLENTVDTETITAANAISWEIVGGTSGSITINMIGMTLEQPSVQNPSVTTKPRLSGGGVGFGPKRRNHPWPSFAIIDHD